MVLDRNFKPGFRIDLHIKDLANVFDTSHGVGAQLPLTAVVMEMMQALKQDDLGTAYHSALAFYYVKTGPFCRKAAVTASSAGRALFHPAECRRRRLQLSTGVAGSL